MFILYGEKDIRPFDLDKFHKSLNRYGEVSKETIEKELENWHYDPLHYSCLIEIGVKLLPDEKSARAYYDDHIKEGEDFERLRRITGYLVGTLSRWNDAKKAEEKARVKHSLGGVYTPEEKTAIEMLKLENSVMAQI